MVRQCETEPLKQPQETARQNKFPFFDEVQLRRYQEIKTRQSIKRNRSNKCWRLSVQLNLHHTLKRRGVDDA